MSSEGFFSLLSSKNPLRVFRKKWGESPIPGTPDKKCSLLVSAYLRQVGNRYQHFQHHFDNSSAVTQILDLSPDEKVRIVVLFIHQIEHIRPRAWIHYHAIQTILGKLLRGKLPFSAETLTAIFELFAKNRQIHYFGNLSGMVRHCKNYVEEHGMTRELEQALRGFREIYSPYGKRDRKLLHIVRVLLGETPDGPIESDEAWANSVLTHLNAMEPETRKQWMALITHAQASDKTVPTKTWKKKAQSLIDAVGEDEFMLNMLAWLPQVRGKEEQRILDMGADLLKGLVWMCGLTNDSRMPKILGDLALACFHKIPGVGARSTKVGNACVRTLGSFDHLDAIAELTRLRRQVDYRNVQSLIRETLHLAAARTGISSDELEEMAVPDMGIREDGFLIRRFGDYVAELEIISPSRTQLLWRKPDGTLQKSVPAAVRQTYADELRAFRRQAKDIQKMIAAQRDRIEQSYLKERQWAYPVWFERYIQHPLMAQVARKLIWQFEDGEKQTQGIWRDGRFINQQEERIDWPRESTIVRLWHPLDFSVETVQNWRIWLEENNITQPFKQAHREIYLLTDAEIETNTYSNRFAAHVLRQHQLNQLCRQRGWHYQLMGAWDSANWPRKSLLHWDLQVEFAVEGIIDENLLTENYASLYVTTDQVRFSRDRQPIPLSEVPAIVFTELMREVDLFVGVCSVGNDPTWQDRGELPNATPYWQNYAFGDLSASAQTRKEVLGRLLPRLKIKDQCSLEDRFLVVKGTKRTYKIHLGSGNILMKPNDQYLCIVPGRSAGKNKTNNLYLPFEGDKTLSVILSKAFMLAEDNKIKDPTIVRQIGK
jgi:hypothetical protein